MSKICVIGTTSWGLTLGLVSCRNGHTVNIWARTKEEADSFSKGINTKQLPKIEIPKNMTITPSIEAATKDADMVIIAVPSQTMRWNAGIIKDHITESMVILSVTKGLEHESNLRMSQVIAEVIDEKYHQNICALSGPNLAFEIAEGLPAAAVVAGMSTEAAQKAQKLMHGDSFSVYTNDDIKGIEFAGSFKNILAIGAGIIDGLHYGSNTKSAFITRGLTEMAAFGTALGANPMTFSGLAGLGDTIATCSSSLSRNHYVGVELAKGRKAKDIVASMSAVSEGVTTIPVVMDEARKMKLEMPITSSLYEIVCNNKDAKDIMPTILGTKLRHELSGRRWKLKEIAKRFV